jgi:uncharacterized NAD(P)/FAD-binding protein YdhS
MKTLAIIGAGFSGTVAAIQFIRSAPRNSQLIMINRSGQMAKGLAYGTNSPTHLLNVPAGNMTAIIGEPNSYLEYCQRRYENITASSFTPRQVYGEYLEFLLNEAELSAKNKVQLKRVTAGVQRIFALEDGAKLELDIGEEIFADQVILALGHFRPLTPPSLRCLEDSDYYIADPWSKKNTVPSATSAPILLVGGGLTALDVVSSLKNENHTGDIYMLSRRGLLPLPHRHSRKTPESHEGLLATLGKLKPTAVNYSRTIRRYIASHPDYNWRDVLAALRATTPELWMRLPDPERRRFLRHLQPYWDVHRHRVAPTTYSTFEEGVKNTKIRTMAGRLNSAVQTDSGIQVTINPRGKDGLETLEVAYIINCTGPNSNPNLVSETFIKTLIENKMISVDKHGIGINVTKDLAVIDGNGIASSWLSYVGPMLKANFWEATAVPELRIHAANVANKVAGIFHAE